MSKLTNFLKACGLTSDEIKEIIADHKPVVTLPKVHQFYSTYSRAGFYREDILRALSDAGCDYQ